MGTDLIVIVVVLEFAVEFMFEVVRLLEDILFFKATRDKSSIVALRVNEVLRAGEDPSWRLADDGILDRRLLVGDVV